MQRIAMPMKCAEDSVRYNSTKGMIRQVNNYSVLPRVGLSGRQGTEPFMMRVAIRCSAGS